MPGVDEPGVILHVDGSFAVLPQHAVQRFIADLHPFRGDAIVLHGVHNGNRIAVEGIHQALEAQLSPSGRLGLLAGIGP
ncbi:hypothetical protein D3C76_1737780 [compost metagenome]